MSSPPPGWAKLQAAMLAEVRCFRKAELNHVVETRVTTLSGERVLEEVQLGVQEDEERAKALAVQKLAVLRKLAGKDNTPQRVAEGLFVGGIGAARNLKALRKRGITHVLNASPAVPCFFRDNPGGAFAYLVVHIYDDEATELGPHLGPSNDFIDAGRAAGGVLVHCAAGQSRSVALVMAYLMARQGLGLGAAWAAVRAARPCASPNSSFLRQLAGYSLELSSSSAAAAPAHPLGGAPAPTAGEDELASPAAGAARLLYDF